MYFWYHSAEIEDLITILVDDEYPIISKPSSLCKFLTENEFVDIITRQKLREHCKNRYMETFQAWDYSETLALLRACTFDIKEYSEVLSTKLFT